MKVIERAKIMFTFVKNYSEPVYISSQALLNKK